MEGEKLERRESVVEEKREKEKEKKKMRRCRGITLDIYQRILKSSGIFF